MTTASARPVCRQCGSIGKSGKSSCCGRGGSWFRNCGSTGNAKLRHTWYEGIQVCKTLAQSKRASGQQSNAAQRLNSSDGVDTGNPKSVTTTVHAFAFMSANTATLIPVRTPSITSVNAFMIKPAVTSDGTSTEYHGGKATIISTSVMTSTATTMLTTAEAHTNSLNTESTATIITAIIATTTTITQAVEEATISTDWISHGMCYVRKVSTCVMIVTMHLHTLVKHL